MLPRKLTGEDTEDERRRWRIVRADTMQDVVGEVLSADIETGICVLRLPNGNTQHFSFGPGGLIIVGARR